MSKNRKRTRFKGVLGESSKPKDFSQRSEKMQEVDVNQKMTMDEGMAAAMEVLSGMLRRNAGDSGRGLIQGLKNIAAMAPFYGDLKPKPVPGMGEMLPGFVAFRRSQKNMNLAVVGGKFPVMYLPMDKLVQVVERMHDPKRRTVIVQNCSDAADSEYARGQILARINPEHSALHVAWGYNSRVIREPDDIAKPGVYYINREDLLPFYLAAKAQLKGGDLLEELLRANEGWREYDLPTNPLDPGAA